ncbi:MAG: Kazal-type serine protease inhibitor family protein [Pseudomonadota bacterium]
MTSNIRILASGLTLAALAVLGTQSAFAVYDPCTGKTCGDSCRLCDPADPYCIETSVLKVCNPAGECTTNYPLCSTNYEGFPNYSIEWYQNYCQYAALDASGDIVISHTACDNVNPLASIDCNGVICDFVQSCGCDPVLNPVCGSNGVTYANECLASCASVPVAAFATCADLRACTASCYPIATPVCGANMITYPNWCYATCSRTAVIAYQACEQVLPAFARAECLANECPYVNDGPVTYAPECGVPRTYLNICDLFCYYSVGSACAEKCAPDDRPVCGVDNVRYANACHAACYNIGVNPWGSCDSCPTY